MVSIIVPVYKVECYLRACVDSILEQTYRELQVILVDDGSPDNCGVICDEYAAKDNRVLVLHKENGGVSAARNLGLQYVAGEYVTFCDSDDLYQPDWIEKLVQTMEDSGADVVLGNYRKILETGEHIGVSKHEIGVVDLRVPEERIRYCFDKLLTEKHAWEIWDRLFKAEIIKKHNLRFCESCDNYAEDLGFVLSYSVFVERVTSIDTAGYVYRIRPGSMMQSSVDKPKLNAVNEVFLLFESVCRDVFSKELAEDMLPVFHFLIMRAQYIAVIKFGEYDRMKDAVAQIRRKEEWEMWARSLQTKKTILISLFGKYNAERILLLNHFCIHRNGFWYRIERRLFYMLKNRMEDCYGSGE